MAPIFLTHVLRDGLYSRLHRTRSSASTACLGIIGRFSKKLGFNPDVSLLAGNWAQDQVSDFGKRSQAHPRVERTLHRTLARPHPSGFDRLGDDKMDSSVSAGLAGTFDAHLWSLLDHCQRHKKTPGIKALLICSMSVMRSKQARRIAVALSERAALHELRTGIYADIDQREVACTVASDSFITDHEVLRHPPPDILLTDYERLEDLLSHARKGALWQRSEPHMLRFLIVEDLHRFGDRQREDVSRLVGSLKDRLGTSWGDLIYVGPSNALVPDDALKTICRRSTKTLFGARFAADVMISERQASPDHVLDHAGYGELPDKRDILSSFRAAEGTYQYKAAANMPLCTGTERLSQIQILLDRLTPDRKFFSERPRVFATAAKTSPAYLVHSFSKVRLRIQAFKLVTLLGNKLHKLRLLIGPSRAPKTDHNALCASAIEQEAKSNRRFYCAKAQVTQQDRALTAGDRFRKIVAPLCTRLGRPMRKKSSLKGTIEDVLVASHLDKRFLGALSKLYGGYEALKPQVLPDGRRGFVLRAGTCEVPRLWAIEPQVNIDIRYPGLPQKRVDFLLTPMGRADARPIAVTIDQSEYHAMSTDKDILDCIEMIRSGALYVFNLPCRELEFEDRVSSPSLSKIARGPVLVERLERILAQPQFAPHANGSTELLTGSSLQGLKCLLDGVAPDAGKLQTALIRVLVATGQPLEYLPVFSELSEAGQRFLAGPGLAERIGEGSVVLYLACAQISSSDLRHTEAELRVLLRADLPEPGKSLLVRGDFSNIYQDLWRLVHLFQGLRGFHLEICGRDLLPPPVMSDTSARTDAPVAAWRQAQALSDVQYHPLIAALIAADVPAPDRFGDDLVSAGRVVGRMEFGWSDASVAVSNQFYNDTTWRLIRHDPERASVEETVTGILAALQDSQ